MRSDKDFMNYVGFRSSEIEDRINDAVETILSSEGHVSIDLSDLNLTSDEQQYVKDEIERRLQEAINY